MEYRASQWLKCEAINCCHRIELRFEESWKIQNYKRPKEIKSCYIVFNAEETLIPHFQVILAIRIIKHHNIINPTHTDNGVYWLWLWRRQTTTVNEWKIFHLNHLFLYVIVFYTNWKVNENIIKRSSVRTLWASRRESTSIYIFFLFIQTAVRQNVAIDS